jgi:predicted outer membrane protein
MNKKKLSLIIVMLSLAGCGGNSGADSLSNASGTNRMLTGVTAVDTVAAAVDSNQFLMDAYRDGLSEIQLSRLALQKTENDQVRKFAQRMIDDHTRMNSAISQLAQSKNITLPNDLSADQTTQINRLTALSGEEFDRAYMAGNVTAHEKDVTAAKQQAEQGTDADVRTLADASLPILEIHLAVAEEINGLLDPSAFLSTLYRDGLLEIQLSQLALQKAVNNNVKQFAQRMIDDHSQANTRIAALAQQKGLTLPTALTAEQQATVDELARFSGVDFDKTYMDKNVVNHVKDVRQAAKQAEQGRDSDVRSFALQTVPVLALHLTTALLLDRDIQPSLPYRIYQDGKAEIQLAQLALMQGSNAQVKGFAQQMITDHTAANAQIRQLAQQRGIALPTEASPLQLRDLVRLMGRSGGEFDKLYMDINVQNHETDVTEATQQSQNATDPDIKALAQLALPVLTTHLTRAKEIQQQLSTSTQP